jgi:hypothetical protein
MRFFYITAVILIAGLAGLKAVPGTCAEPQAVAPAFFSNMDDVPLMPGLAELVDQAILFDKPDGRFIESAAVSDNVSGQSISRFYDETLPQLGWRKIKDGRFVRQEEQLQIDIREEGASRLVVVTVMPRLSAPDQGQK